jgi:inosose dehydratase
MREAVTAPWRQGRCRLAICPIGWVNGFLGWGRASGEQVMDEIAQLGYLASENSAVYPRDPELLRYELEGRGLTLSAAYKWVNFAYPERLEAEMAAAKRHVDFCAQAGAHVVNLAEAGHSVWDARGPVERVTPFSAQQWSRVAAGFEEVGAYARERGVTLAVHPHGGTAIETPVEILTLLDLTDPGLVGLCLDTGHVAYGGGDAVGLTRQVAERVVYVHLKDVRTAVLHDLRAAAGSGTGGLSALGVGFETAVRAHLFCPPGQGQLDLPGVLDALLAADYDGWFVVEAEQDPELHDPFEAGRSAHAFVTAALRAARQRCA